MKDCCCVNAARAAMSLNSIIHGNHGIEIEEIERA